MLASIRAIILRPLVNEKSMSLTKNNFYTFVVAKEATKYQIQQAITQKFKVDVISLRTINTATKRKTQRTRKGYYQVASFKKAIVKIKAGQKIALFEVAEPEKEVEIRTVEGEVITKVKEKKSLLKGTKVKVEKVDNKKVEAKKKEGK